MGGVLGLLASDRAVAGQGSREDYYALPGSSAGEECKCCEQDWCGCTGDCIDCQAYLKAKGYRVPLAAPEAYAAAGKTAWATATAWSSAQMPGWRPVAERDLFVQNSTLEGAGSGLFTSADLPAGTVMPPYQGTMMTYAETKGGGTNVWCPLASGMDIMNMEDEEARSGPRARELSFCVDGRPPKTSNFINAAATKAECKAVNVEICEIGRVMYYRTTRPVPRGAELVTEYGDFYFEGMESKC